MEAVEKEGKLYRMVSSMPSSPLHSWKSSSARKVETSGNQSSSSVFQPPGIWTRDGKYVAVSECFHVLKLLPGTEKKHTAQKRRSEDHTEKGEKKEQKDGAAIFHGGYLRR